MGLSPMQSLLTALLMTCESLLSDLSHGIKCKLIKKQQQNKLNSKIHQQDTQSHSLIFVLSHSCWLKSDIAFYVTVVAYFCVIFLFNFIMFVVVLVQLGRMRRQNPHNLQHRTKLQDARSIMGITTLLGLTWGFAFFAWGPVSLAFMYLFAIFNGLQGKLTHLSLAIDFIRVHQNLNTLME